MSFVDIKLGSDGIREALCEFRFETSQTPEIVVGRLTDAAVWKGFVRTRLPTADFPAQLRQVDPNIKFQPTYELTSVEHGNRKVRIGPNVISCHMTEPYGGWDEFESFLATAVQTLFEQVEPTIIRVGFRYINTLNELEHHITDTQDLDLTVKVGNSDLNQGFMLNYRVVSDQHICQTNVATPEYVNAPGADAFTTLIDIDVFTPANYRVGDLKIVMDWISVAHLKLKEQFFTLLPDSVIEILRKK